MRILLALLLCVAATAAAEGIRTFPLPTVMALGRELHERDKIAAVTSDALFSARPEARERPIRGWITQLRGPRGAYWIQEIDGKPSLAYLVTLVEGLAPVVDDKRGEALPEPIARRFAARKAAIKAVTLKLWTGPSYNFEVLDDPQGRGFLVYALAATKSADEHVLAGHFRVSVDADGITVRRVDALSRSLLIQPKPKGEQIEALVATHLVSKTPLETHVYTSLLHRLPFFIATSPKDTWLISNGQIERVDKGKK